MTIYPSTPPEDRPDLDAVEERLRARGREDGAAFRAKYPYLVGAWRGTGDEYASSVLAVARELNGRG